MQFPAPLLTGRLVGRRQRFFADVLLDSGQQVVAHCPNPGSMATCAPIGARVWLSHQPAPHRKLRYTWELVDADGSMVCVNTGLANQIAVEAVRGGRIPELDGYDEIRREVRYGQRSRVDILLCRATDVCFVEVKSVTLRVADGVSAFPDSVSERGTRHLLELIDVVRNGGRGVLLFCCGRERTRSVVPADHIDPTYGQTLRAAVGKGVEVLAYRCHVRPERIAVAERVPVDLGPQALPLASGG